MVWITYTVVWQDSPSESPVFRLSGSTTSRPAGLTSTAANGRLQETVNQVTRAGSSSAPAVAVGQDNSKVIVWEDDSNENGSYQILASAWESNGFPPLLPTTWS